MKIKLIINSKELDGLLESLDPNFMEASKKGKKKTTKKEKKHRLQEILDNITEEQLQETFLGLIKETVKIPVKHNNALKVPKNKKFWQLPLSHYIQLAKKEGRAKILRRLNALYVWNKNKHPEIAKRAASLRERLKKATEPKKKKNNKK